MAGSGMAGQEAAGNLRLDFAADPMAVRRALQFVVEALEDRGVAADDRALAEVLLAEVLNNVVEHAYDRRGGWIEIELSVSCLPGPMPGVVPAAVTAGGGGGRPVAPAVAQSSRAELGFVVYDWGRALPGGTLPDGRLPPIAAGELPEGGFGWYLIRALASDLNHGREGGRNWLRFSLVQEQRAALG
ncbi:ATP-binding protein [Acidimangrovimonas sediminis]|uniref:ATP-binding protein n=1 Tax=Acidimangrovimonas sediminis TaxID=2056283 RepID=UPI0013047EEA|nr:ATP-binding protein [Acidimangrovimonas sediminis]